MSYLTVLFVNDNAVITVLTELKAWEEGGIFTWVGGGLGVFEIKICFQVTHIINYSYVYPK